jgi:hypothetical protein
LLIVDAITAYGGKVDWHNNAKLRSLLGPLAKFAAKHGIVVLGVAHLNKKVDKKGKVAAMERVATSMALVAASRSTYFAMEGDDDPGIYHFLPAKANYSDARSGFAYRIEKVELPGGIKTTRIKWLDFAVDKNADEAINEERGDASKLAAACAFLRDTLSGKAIMHKELQSYAREAGHACATIRRAKDVLGDQTEQVHDGRQIVGWKWYLPRKQDNPHDGEAAVSP